MISIVSPVLHSAPGASHPVTICHNHNAGNVKLEVLEPIAAHRSLLLQTCCFHRASIVFTRRIVTLPASEKHCVTICRYLLWSVSFCVTQRHGFTELHTSSIRVLCISEKGGWSCCGTVHAGHPATTCRWVDSIKVFSELFNRPHWHHQQIQHIRYIHNTYIIHTDTYSIYQNIIKHPADSSFRCFQDQTAAISCHDFSISIDPGQWMVHLKDLSMLHMCLWWGSILGLTALVQGAAALSCPNLFASGTGSRQSLLSCSASSPVDCLRKNWSRHCQGQILSTNHPESLPTHSVTFPLAHGSERLRCFMIYINIIINLYWFIGFPLASARSRLSDASDYFTSWLRRGLDKSRLPSLQQKSHISDQEWFCARIFY